ncbi:hypothetical protein BIV25_43355 [Streptomyces sp. MUSC 14]|nr:hypothetical protein BIV25_43355 [Streptomyces sp. MUSC 14]
MQGGTRTGSYLLVNDWYDGVDAGTYHLTLSWHDTKTGWWSGSVPLSPFERAGRPTSDCVLYCVTFNS